MRRYRAEVGMDGDHVHYLVQSTPEHSPTELVRLVNYLILAFAKGEASSFLLSLDSFSSLLCRLLTTESDALSTGVLVRSTQVQVIFPKPASRIVFALFTSRSSL